MRAILTLTITVVVVGSILAAEPTTWPQWRGPSRDGHIVQSAPWPNSLREPALRVSWNVADLGASYSGPIVAADRVFVTGTIEKKREVVRALDRETGKELWKVEWEGAIAVPFFAARNGDWIRATPAYDGETLYVAGIRDVVVALDGKTGQERWRVDFPKLLQTPLPTFGFVCSPLVHGDALYVQAGASFVKLDKRTGKILWRVLKDDGGMMGSAFSSPVWTKLGGRDQLLVQTRAQLAGVDPTDGKVLWSRAIPSFRGMNILTPVPFGEGVFTSTYGGNTQWFPVNATSEAFTVGQGWSLRYEGNMSTPVVVNGHAYLLGKDQRFLCVDLKTGKELWRTDRRFGQYWSLVVNGDQLLALDQTGKLLLIRANPKECELLDERTVGTGETWAHLAICGEEVFVRDLHGLTRFRWSTPTK